MKFHKSLFLSKIYATQRFLISARNFVFILMGKFSFMPFVTKFVTLMNNFNTLQRYWNGEGNRNARLGTATLAYRLLVIGQWFIFSTARFYGIYRITNNECPKTSFLNR